MTEQTPTITAKLPTLAQAQVMGDRLAQCFRDKLQTKFTGNIRVASDGFAYMGEFSQRRNGKIVVTWYRLQINLG